LIKSDAHLTEKTLIGQPHQGDIFDGLSVGRVSGTNSKISSGLLIVQHRGEVPNICNYQSAWGEVPHIIRDYRMSKQRRKDISVREKHGHT